MNIKKQVSQQETVLLVINKRRTVPIIKSVLIMKRVIKEINHHCGFHFRNLMIWDSNTHFLRNDI